MKSFQPSDSFRPYYDDIIRGFHQAETDVKAYENDRFPLCFYAPDEYEAEVIAFVLWFSDDHPRYVAEYWNEDGLLIIKLGVVQRRCPAAAGWLRRLRRHGEQAKIRAGKAAIHKKG